MVALVETLASYVPALITQRLARDPRPIELPTAERFPAAVLLADISGFTPLTERLVQRGPTGVEDLSRILNASFGQLIDLVTEHGGDIVKLAGDALLALWPAANSDLSAATRRAAQCAMAVQAAFHHAEPAEHVRLSLHIGIGAGEVVVVHLGGVYGRADFLLVDEALVQLRAAEGNALPGEVVLSPEAWTLIQEHVVGAPLPAGGWRLERVRDLLPPPPLSGPRLVPEMDTALRAYIPGAILSRLVAGQTGWLAELRHVTVIFLNLPVLNSIVPLEQAQAAMVALQTALYRYEGSINMLSVDDKGVTLVAALGLPPLAHEDDAVRGVQAALAMQAALREMAMPSAIGVTSGRVFCGSVGSARRRTYTMLGDAVNLAARLMEAAPDDLLCDTATYQAARTRLQFAALPPISVKGKAEPVAVYRPLGEVQETVRPRAAMVGRTAERTMLAEQIQALLHGGAGSVVIIEGEAGIGKSRLVEDLLAKAQTWNVTSLVGAGDAIRQSTPYHAWRPVFSQLFGLDTLGDDPEAQRARVLARIADDGRLVGLAPLLNAVLPLDLPENELTAQMSSEVRASNTRDLLLRLLQAAASRAPTMLILEDAHWLDSASWALALEASQRVHPLLLAIVTRPLADPLPPDFQAMLAAPATRRLRLEALPGEEALALVCQRLGVTALPEGVAALIREKAEGHPFFSEELAYALRDAGLIEVRDGECRLARDVGDLSTLILPNRVEGIITSRIDRLAPPQQLTLKVASVIGRIFALRTLSEIHPIAADKPYLADYLDTLQRLDLTPLDTPEPELTYLFKHAITREVAYNLMSFEQRRQLHRMLAEWYERSYASDLSPYYPLLAYHWQKAEVASKTTHYLERAGEQALQSGAYQEAASFFSDALALHARTDLGGEQSRRAHWHRQLGEAHYGLGHLVEARTHLKRAVALADRTMPATRGRLVVALIAQILRQVLYWMGPVRRMWPLRRGGDEQPAMATVLDAVRAYERLGQIYYITNEALPLLYTFVRGFNLAASAGPTPELARAYAGMGGAAALVPLHALARAYNHRAWETAERTNDLAAQAWVSELTGHFFLGSGQWAEAQPAFERASEIYTRLGDQRHWAESQGLLAQAFYYQGQFPRSAQLYADNYASTRAHGDVQIQLLALLGQVETACLPQGQFDAAMNLMDTAMTLLNRPIGGADEIWAYGVLSLIHLRRGEEHEARQTAERAAHLTGRALPTVVYQFGGYADVAEVYLELWERSASHLPMERKALGQRARRACKAMRQFGRVFRIGRPRAWLLQGRYDWLAGKPSKARKAWQKSLAAAERLAMPYDQGLAHYEIGRHITGTERQHHLARAHAIFAHLGATYDVQRTQLALDSSSPMD